MKQIQKKFLSLLVVAVMMVMLLPVTAQAASTMTGETLLATASNGVITLTDDVHLTSTMEISAGQNITLDLAGHKITVNKPANSLYAVINLGTFTLKDSIGGGSITARGIQNGKSGNGTGTMLIESGKIVACDANGGAAIYNYGNRVTVNGGTFETASCSDGSAPDPATLINNGGNVVVNKGTFTSNANLAYAVINSAGTMTINQEVSINGIHGAVAVEGGSAVINGASLVARGISGQSDHCVYTSGSATITLNGGTYTNNDSTAGSSCVYANGGSIDIKDGTFEGGCYNVNAAEGDVTISGGTFDEPLGQTNGSISISGGTFDEEPENEWIADGVEKKDNGDGTYTVIDPNASVEEETAEAEYACVNHDFEWTVNYDATEIKDGMMSYSCKHCGHVADTVKISAYAKFLQNTTEAIKKAPAGSTVKIKTDLWVSFSKAVAAALQTNPGVAIEVQFVYAGHVFKIVIPAGYDLMAKMNEDGYAGFAYLATDPALNLQWIR